MVDAGGHGRNTGKGLPSCHTEDTGRSPGWWEGVPGKGKGLELGSTFDTDKARAEWCADASLPHLLSQFVSLM